MFLAVPEEDVKERKAFFKSLGLPTAFERQPRDALAVPVQIVLEPRSSLDIEHVDGYLGVPRTETVDYMREHYAQFQSALSMLDRLYDDIDLGVT